MLDKPPHDDHRAYERWPPADPTYEKPEWSMPRWNIAIGRGLRGSCPSCGRAPIFAGYLTVHPVCAHCAAPLGAMPADDTPPYIAMLIVLHVAAFVIVMIFRFGVAPNMMTYAVLLLLLIGVCLVALRVAKGAVIAILMKLGTKRGALG